MASESSTSSSQVVEEKIFRYEKFLNDTLKGDLKKALDERDKVYEQVAEYLKLENTINGLQESQKTGETSLKTRVDLGSNFYVQANVPDCSRICVSAGLGFYIEMTLEEALKFIQKKTKLLNSVAENLTKDTSRIKAHIKLVLEGLREIQGMDGNPDKPSYRDVFS